MAWSSSIWVARIARGLGGLGFTVLIAADGVEDAAIFQPEDPRIRVIVRRPLRKLRSADPLGVARWYGTIQGSHPSARTISFTRYHPAHLWIPLGASILATLAHAAFSHRPATAAMELLHRPWAPQAFLAERRARSLARSLGAVRAVLGADRCEGVGSEQSPATLGYASALVPPDPGTRASLRGRTRDLFSIPDSATVFVTSAVHHDRRGLLQMLEGFAALRNESRADGDQAVHLLIVGRKTHTLAKLSQRAGLGREVHLVGGTDRMDAIFSAADAAVAFASRPEPASTGRFVADSLRLGVPVVASSQASGSELLRGAPSTQTSGGLTVDPPSAGAWLAALRTANSPPWRAIASARAAEIGAALTIPALCMRIAARLGLEIPCDRATSPREA